MLPPDADLCVAPRLPPAWVVNSAAEARQALAQAANLTLLSAPGAALFGGCLWWQGIIVAAHAGRAGPPAPDVLDCADAPARALEALRAGQRLLVLAPDCPAFPALAQLAHSLGAVLLPARPMLGEWVLGDWPTRAPGSVSV